MDIRVVGRVTLNEAEPPTEVEEFGSATVEGQNIAAESVFGASKQLAFFERRQLGGKRVW
jgi:hypothetical protein